MGVASLDGVAAAVTWINGEINPMLEEDASIEPDIEWGVLPGYPPIKGDARLLVDLILDVEVDQPVRSLCRLDGVGRAEADSTSNQGPPLGPPSQSSISTPGPTPSNRARTSRVNAALSTRSPLSCECGTSRCRSRLHQDALPCSPFLAWSCSCSCVWPES